MKIENLIYMDTNYLLKNKTLQKSIVFYKIVSEDGFILWSETMETNKSFSEFITEIFGKRYEYFDEDKQIAKFIQTSDIDKTKELVYVQLIAYPNLEIELDLNNLYIDEYFNLN